MCAIGRSELIMNRCEVVGVRNLADEIGVPCTRTASQQCSDCAIQTCESHAERCDICQETFCSCLTLRAHARPPPDCRLACFTISKHSISALWSWNRSSVISARLRNAFG